MNEQQKISKRGVESGIRLGGGMSFEVPRDPSRARVKESS